MPSDEFVETSGGELVIAMEYSDLTIPIPKELMPRDQSAPLTREFLSQQVDLDTLGLGLSETASVVDEVMNDEIREMSARSHSPLLANDPDQVVMPLEANGEIAECRREALLPQNSRRVVLQDTEVVTSWENLTAMVGVDPKDLNIPRNHVSPVFLEETFPNPRRIRLEHANWLASTKPIIHNPKVYVDEGPPLFKPPANFIPEEPKLDLVMERIKALIQHHVDHEILQQGRTLEATQTPNNGVGAVNSLDLAHQEDAFYRTSNRRVYQPERIGSVTLGGGGHQWSAMDLKAIEAGGIPGGMLDADITVPIHFFSKPEGDFTGTTVLINRPGSYKFGEGDAKLRPGAYQVHDNPDGTSRLVLIRAIDLAINEIRRRIRQNLSPIDRLRRRVGISRTEEVSEQRARRTLRDLVTEAEWRQYLKTGTLMVRGQSGRHYRVSAYEKVQIFQNRKMIGRLCIHSEKVPPSDHIINCKIMIELDEETFLQSGNFTDFTEAIDDPFETAILRSPAPMREATRHAMRAMVPTYRGEENLVETFRTFRQADGVWESDGLKKAQ